jgi:DHA1 family multidrug resistance protein-like MFS transporter
MSEVPQIGRNPVYIGALFVFVFLQFAVIYTTNFSMFLAFRFLTGFFGSPVLATGGATLSDMYAPKQRAYGISTWGVAAMCGLTMGPLVADSLRKPKVGHGRSGSSSGFLASLSWSSSFYYRR